jgi:two-component system, chemotaxis family, chemotaxis protein CheY
VQEGSTVARILIADGVAYLRALCHSILAPYQIEVVEAANGAEAVRKYHLARPDGVILDISMPVLDGLAALELIRQINPVARVAILTANGGQDMVLRAIRAGACDFVVKPFATTRLEQLVCTLLERPTLSLPTTTTDSRSEREPSDSPTTAASGQAPTRVLIPEVPAHQCVAIGRACTYRGCTA